MRRRYWIAVGVLAVAVLAAGSAFAATKLSSQGARSQAVIDDAAGRLHVTPTALSAALKHALDDQVDAAVAAGRLTKTQGDAFKARIDAGHVPLLGGFGLARALGGPPFGLGFRHARPALLFPGVLGAGLRVVTSYLGITRAQLKAALVSGKDLAQIAQEQGKTADGLVAALVAAAKSRLHRAGHLSAAQEQAILDRMRAFLDGVVHRTLPAPLQRLPQLPGHGFGLRHRQWGPLRGPCTASSSCDTS